MSDMDTLGYDAIRAIREVVREEVDAFRRRELKPQRGKDGHFPYEVFKQLAKLGIAGMSISEGYGGVDFGVKQVYEVIRNIAYEDLGPAIFMSVHNMVARIIEAHGNIKQRERYLPPMAKGELLGAFALTEPQAGSDAKNLRTTLTKTANNEYIINGEKTFITSAGFADVYVCFGKMAENEDKNGSGITAFIVEKGDEGLEFGSPEEKMGCELSPIAAVVFKEVRISKDRILGEIGNGYKAALSALSRGRINIAACALGLAGKAIDMSCEYMRNRKQFGKVIGEFQGLQFMLAEMETQYRASEALVERTASLIDKGTDVKTERVYSSMAKLYATDMAMQVTTSAVQIFGGYGYIKEMGVEKLMRDAKMLQIVEGTNEIQKVIIAREILDRFK